MVAGRNDPRLTRSTPCVLVTSRVMVSCTPLAGAVTIVMVPPPSSPTPATLYSVVMVWMVFTPAADVSVTTRCA